MRKCHEFQLQGGRAFLSSGASTRQLGASPPPPLGDMSKIGCHWPVRDTRGHAADARTHNNGHVNAADAHTYHIGTPWRLLGRLSDGHVNGLFQTRSAQELVWGYEVRGTAHTAPIDKLCRMLTRQACAAPAKEVSPLQVCGFYTMGSNITCATHFCPPPAPAPIHTSYPRAQHLLISMVRSTPLHMPWPLRTRS